MKLSNVRLQFITHHTDRYSYIDSARIALEGGCRWIQLRMKGVDESVVEHTAIIVQRMCRACGATFIIDDNVALAKRIAADGVHLGRGDMPIADARKILGEHSIIGGTVNSFEDVLCHLQSAAPDYFGCGPYRYTSTKRDLAPILGIDGYKNIVNEMCDNNIDIPIVAIGGIAKEDITPILECGMSGIALSGSVLNATNPTREMNDIVRMIL